MERAAVTLGWAGMGGGGDAEGVGGGADAEGATETPRVGENAEGEPEGQERRLRRLGGTLKAFLTGRERRPGGEKHLKGAGEREGNPQSGWTTLKGCPVLPTFSSSLRTPGRR